MVKRYKQSSSSVSAPRSLAGSENGSCSRRDSCKDKEDDQTYCVILHVVEAINFCGRDGEHEQIVMNAALNTVDFEIEGQPSATAETIIFNSNCIWECDMAGIKRIKTDHRPVKVTFYSCSSQSERKTIGTLLLPIRGLPVLTTTGNQTALQLKMFWHKLICISNEFRSHKPEVLLMLAIVKKSLLHTQDFEHLMQFANPKSPPTPPLQSPGHSITSNMLHSQANVYVQSLVQLGLLQVGNDPLIDCDIIEVVLQLKQLKNVCRLVKSLNLGKDVNTVLLVFDFVGNVTNIELKLNEKDSYVLNDVLGLRFKSSLRSMRLYFQRIFYLPINMYINGTAIANYRMDFGNLMPEDSYFDDNRKYVLSGSFTFNRLGRMDSARDLKPLIEYTFSVDVKSICSRQSQHGRIEDEMEPSLASGCSVIRQLPEEHKDSEAGSNAWQHQDDASNASLSVGAELSASDNDAGQDLDSPLDIDNNDDEPPKDLPKHQGRRKKFTRLTGHQECQDSEEDVCLVKKFSSMVVRQPLEHTHKVAAEPEDYPEPLSSDFDEEVLAQYNKFNKDKSAMELDFDEINTSKKQRQPLKKRESSVKFGEEQSQQETENDLRKNGKKEHITKVNMKPSQKVKSDTLGYVQLEETRNEYASTKESIRLKKIRSAGNTTESHNNNVSKEDKSNKLKKIQSACANFNIHNNDQISNRDPAIGNEIIKTKSNSKPKLIASQSEDQLLRGARKLEEINAADLQLLPKMESILGKKERMRNRHQKLDNSQREGDFVEERVRSKTVQKVCKPERGIGEEHESEHSFSQSNSRCSGRCSHDDVCARRIDSNTDFFSREVISELRKEKSKGSNHLILDTCDPNLDDLQHHHNVIQKESKRKLKSQSVSYTDNFDTSVANVKESKRIPRTPKSETALSARWVEVNKNQEKVLKETENFIEQLCKTDEQHLKRTKVKINNNENNIEENSISPTSKPTKRIQKKQAILEEQEMDLSYQLENSEEYLALKVIDSQSTLTNYLSNSEVIAPEMLEKKPTKRIVRKKIVRKTEFEIEEPDKSTEITESLQNDPIEPITKKIIKKTTRKITEPLAEYADDIEKSDSLEVLRVERPKKIVRKKSSELVDHQDEHSSEFMCNPPEMATEMANGKRQQINQEFQSKFDNRELEQLHHSKVLEESQCDSIYESKFIDLEEHVAKLKLEMEEQVEFFHQRSEEMSEENMQLRLEKSQLEKHISRMENELKLLRQNKHGLEVGQDVKQVLNELAKQNKRYIDLAKERDRYKRQCRMKSKKIHSLKLSIYERNIADEYGRNNTDLGMLNLKNIITKDPVEFEREYGQFRHPRSIPSFQISSESEELSSLASRQALSVESFQR